MNKNIFIGIIIVLALACVVEGYFIIKERNEKIAVSMHAGTLQNHMTATNPSMGKRPKPMFVMKGQTFSESPLFPKAYLIFPVSGNLPADTQKALSGWDVKTTANTDGSTQIDLIPKEAEDVKQSFTVRQGYKLYFIEMTLSDDQTGVDENRGDDIGVLVDQNGKVL